MITIRPIRPIRPIGTLLCVAVCVGVAWPEDPAAPPDVWRALKTVPRDVPRPAEGHPGNVFVVGETVTIPMPSGAARGRVLDDRGATVAEGGAGANLDAGALGIGWYRVEFLDDAGATASWTTAAVLTPLTEPVPQDSPVCIDSATAWFARNDPERQKRFYDLAALAGVNWIRDRMTWGDVETAPGVFTDATTSYDTSATLALEHGLKSLQVFHSTPAWATRPDLDGDEAGGRFPRDLRQLHAFCKAMAQRYRGRVRAWEPWNESNIPNFGGHTIDEMCALQKAGYLGFKAGDPDVAVCWTVFAGPGSKLDTEGVLANEAWPYFETYNIHTYNPPRTYLPEFAGPREAACGRPIWISECGIGLPWDPASEVKDFSAGNDLRQAEFIAHSYASSLYAGVNRHFFFILGHYSESKIQFGLLRHDMTPRPAYVALAATGRFLAGARCLGRTVGTGDPQSHLYAFRGRPDGVEADVLVAWADKDCPWPVSTPLDVRGVYDHLGRTLEGGLPASLGPASVFVVLAAGEADKLGLEPLSPRAAYRTGTASPVVLQVEMPQTATRLGEDAHEVEAGKTSIVPVAVYNFSEQPVSGSILLAEIPEGWRAGSTQWSIELAPQDRRLIEVPIHMSPEGAEALRGAWVTLRGDFGDAGRPVLAFRLIAPAGQVQPSVVRALPEANDAARWEDNIVGGATMTHEACEGGGAVFTMTFGQSDPWGYPRLRLRPEEAPEAGMEGLIATVQVLEGEGAVRAQFIEDNGAAYAADLDVRRDVCEPQRVTALFDRAQWGSYSPQDPDGALQPEKIRTILIGINAKKDTAVRLAIRDLAWMKY